MPTSAHRLLRCLTVVTATVLSAGSAVLATAPLAVGPLAQAVRALGPGAPEARALDFSQLVGALAAVVVLLAELWLALVVVACALEACGRVRLSWLVDGAGGCPRVVRRSVLALCGAALLAGAATPALAADVTPLPLPDRPTGRLVQPTDHPAHTTRLTGSAPHRAARRVPQAAPRRTGHRSTASAAPEAGARTGTQMSPGTSPGTSAGDVVVAPGDSLWRIATRTLPDDAGPAAVDARWHEIARLNAAALRGHPDLIHPGLRLALPPGTRPADRP